MSISNICWKTTFLLSCNKCCAVWDLCSLSKMLVHITFGIGWKYKKMYICEHFDNHRWPLLILDLVKYICFNITQYSMVKDIVFCFILCITYRLKYLPQNYALFHHLVPSAS